MGEISASHPTLPRTLIRVKSLLTLMQRKSLKTTKVLGSMTFTATALFNADLVYFIVVDSVLLFLLCVQNVGIDML